MTKAFFVTGTDTEVGKTRVCELLLYSATRAGLKSLGLKPVAAGAERVASGALENEDATRLMAASSFSLPYSKVNPVCVPEPLSPHIAAQRAGVSIVLKQLKLDVESALNAGADFVLVEGAGGWRVPINSQQTLADLAQSLALPVILVVGMRLGCINHALLSAEAIRADGLTLFGWVANQIDEHMPAFDENVATLRRQISAPLLGCLPFGAEPTDLGAQARFDMAF